MLYLLAIIPAIWRLTDGGWYRLPYVSTIGGWLLPSAVLWLTTHDPYIAALGLILGRQITQGYEDWNDVIDMALRALPAAAFAICVGALSFLDVVEVNPYLLFAGFASVFVTNVIQPWLREFMDGRGPWPTHSNRYAELLEGLGVGLACVLV